MENNFFYFTKSTFSISDLAYCEKSERSFDVNLFDLANNRDLLAKLKLYYIQGNYGREYTYQTRAEWFCKYLESFKIGDEAKRMHEKALTNPIVRILVNDEYLFAELKQMAVFS
jgi:hypothetical protein